MLERWTFIVSLLYPVVTIGGAIYVIHRDYQRLRRTVKQLVELVAELKKLEERISTIDGKVDKLQLDMIDVREDLVTIREHQQRDADNEPVKGQLEELETKKHE